VSREISVSMEHIAQTCNDVYMWFHRRECTQCSTVQVLNFDIVYIYIYIYIYYERLRDA